MNIATILRSLSEYIFMPRVREKHLLVVSNANIAHERSNWLGGKIDKIITLHDIEHPVGLRGYNHNLIFDYSALIEMLDAAAKVAHINGKEENVPVPTNESVVVEQLERITDDWSKWKKEDLRRELKHRLKHFYGRIDGTSVFPNSLEGDLLKMVHVLLKNEQ